MNHLTPREPLTRHFRSLTCFVLFFCATLRAFAGFSVQDGLLYDNNGHEFIMRGVNFPHVWFPTQTATAIPNIAATGANCVRVVLGAGKQWGPNSAADVAALIELCKAHKLIPILEVHDCTGFGEAPLAAPLSLAVDYWLSIQEVLKGQENFVIINIANEPLGNGVPAAKWVGDHSTAITRLRAAGLTHTLMVDGANWGQDWEQIMFNNARTVFNSDPLKNILFSIHMYQVYAARAPIQNYLSAFVTNKLPILVGEFGADHQGEPVDEGSILEICQTLGLGYIGWSWSGNSGGTESLDITLNFNPATLSSWGTTLIKSANGITATSQLASVFGDVPRLGLTPGALSLAVTGSTNPVTVKTNRSWTVTDNQPWITVTPTSGTGAADGSIAVTTTANPDVGPRTGTVTVTAGGLTRNLTVSQIGTGGSGVCGSAVPITLPLVKDGVGDFCWVTSGTINSINSSSMQLVEINGVSFTNRFSTVMPPRINGNYYIRYSGGFSYSHLEIAGNGGVTPVPVTGITVTPTPLNVPVGAASTLTAIITPANATNKAVIWRSASPTTAIINSNGQVFGVSNGTTLITATTEDGGFTATVLVTVAGRIPVTGVVLTPLANPTVPRGGTVALTATVMPADATFRTIVWSTNAPSIATVSASGVVTGVAPGNVTITATTIDGGFVDRVTLTVLFDEIRPQVFLNPPNASVSIGATTTLTATVLPASTPNKTIIWSSNAPGIATVSATGIVTGVTVGTATITATLADTTTGAVARAIVTVTDRLPPTPCANPVVSTLPLTHNGAGEFCFVISGNVSFINSWNMQLIEVNGVDFTNKWANSLPPRIDGNYYIRYVANVPWAHLEVMGAP